MRKIYSYLSLNNADLVVDATYEGGTAGNAGDDPISKTLKTGNQGGFRWRGGYNNSQFCVLFSGMDDSEWPDEMDYLQGLFTFYGDNKKPGHELHDTKKKGNLILSSVFEKLKKNKLKEICPFFIFTKADKGRSVIFRGLAVPGARDLNHSEDLIAVWKKSKDRFLNYKSIFTILDVQTISRKWIDDLINQVKNSPYEPKVFTKWKETGNYSPLIAPEVSLFRTREEQIPNDEFGKKIIGCIHKFFNETPGILPADFEKCAVEIANNLVGVISCDRTRPWKDGGRDAIGTYRIGTVNSYTIVEFALEAKCYNLDNACGVKQTSRLISRIKHRQFGIFITTSYLHKQAYEEILEDSHPLLILSAVDIVEILIEKIGLSNNDINDSILKLEDWLIQVSQ